MSIKYDEEGREESYRKIMKEFEAGFRSVVVQQLSKSGGIYRVEAIDRITEMGLSLREDTTGNTDRKIIETLVECFRLGIYENG